jgi:sugar (pentulose or hexulose) kinase
MAQDLVIGLDSSTTATKAIAWDAQGRALAEGRAAVALANPRPGWFEQDPAEWWLSAANALAAVTATIDPARIAAVSISNQRETFAPFGADDAALRPGTVWLDERAKPQVRALAKRLGAERIHAITGKPSDVTPCVYRFAWIAESEPAVWSRLAMLGDVHAVLTRKLTGEWATSTASADPLGALDMARLEWSTVMLDAVGLRLDQMPRLGRPGTVLGQVTAEAAARTGLRAGTPVVAGGGDGQCAGTGTNMLAPGRAYVNLGTAVVSGAWGEAYRHDRAFRTMSAVAETGYIYETCLRSGTFLVNWLASELFQADPRAQAGLFARLEGEAAEAGIGAGGLVLVPYWSGCMTPYWDADARGVIAGLSSSHKRGHVYRALLEGIALEQAGASDRVAAATGVPIAHYVAIGGGSASDLWCQILADASDRAVLRSTTVEASSLGAGIAAAVGAGWFASFAEAAGAMAGEITQVFEPDARRAARYGDLLAIHRDLWPTLASWNARLAAFVEAGHD